MSAPSRWFARVWPPLEAETFEAQHQQLALRGARAFTALMLLMLLLAWPSDRWAFGDVAGAVEALTRWRAALAVLFLAALLLFRLVPTRFAHPTIFFAAGVGASACAFFLAPVDALVGQGWLHSALLAPLGTMVLTSPLRWRVPTTLLVALGFTVAFLAGSTGPVEQEGVVSLGVNLVVMCVGSVALGHVGFRLVRETFLASRRERERASELERAVAERTAELRRLGAHLQTSLESERQRIARELHDETSQLLTGLRLELAVLEESVEEGELERLQALLTETFEAEKRVVRSLRPPELDGAGLGAAIRAHVAALEARAPFTITLSIDPPDPEVAPDAAIALFRLVQEALTNATRHAQAEQVRVTLRRTAGAIELEVVDDGVGFHPPQVATDRFGLLGLRERFDAIDGSFTVESEPDEGATLRARVPLNRVPA